MQQPNDVRVRPKRAPDGQPHPEEGQYAQQNQSQQPNGYQQQHRQPKGHPQQGQPSQDRQRVGVNPRPARTVQNGGARRMRVTETAQENPAMQPSNNSQAATKPQSKAVRRVNAKSDKIRNSDIVLHKHHVDPFMLIITVVLLCFGSIMVFSASYPSALSERGDSFHYIRKQMVFVAIGTVLIVLICKFFTYRFIRKVTPLYFLALCVLLVLVPIYGLAAQKAVRWLPVFGFQFQPSEFMKLGLVLMLAWYMEKAYEKIHNGTFWQSSFHGVFVPIAIIGVACGLIMAENHFSCVIIMFLIGAVMIWVSGAKMLWLGIFGAAGTGIVGGTIFLTDYAQKRIDVWLHPENYSALNETWQTTQGLIAIGSGGVFGLGLGQGHQKHLYVSEPQNDFIFSIICEELGFIGAIAVIVLFGLFIWRGLVIAFHAPDTFSSLVAIGIVSKIAIQTLLNMMVVTNTIPNTGISLPFFSYGGSALISTMMECGVLLSISQYSYQEK